MKSIIARGTLKLLIATFSLSISGCMEHDTTTRSAPTERATLGELAYALVDYNMAVRDDLTCQEARLDSLELREDIFVSSVDTVARLNCS